MKRAIGLFLALVTVLTLLSSGVGAAEGAELTACGPVGFKDASRITYANAVAVAAGLGLFSGTADGNFDPTGSVTRAQMAAVTVKMLKGGSFNADAYKGEANPFSDTAGFEGGWAEGYINACRELGVVSGYSDGTFRPEKEVTAAEALTMVINALKVDAGAGEWPATVMNKAAELKLCDALKTAPTADAVLNREELAVVVSAGVQYAGEGGQSLLSSVFGVNKINVEHKYDETTKLCTVCGAAAPVDASADNEYNILLLGNSYSYYWTDELWGLLDAAGYQNVSVCNIYYSGCTFEMHWNWHVQDKSNYTFFICDSTGRHSIKEANLDTCLAYKAWDAISFQQSGTYMYKGGEQAHRESIQKDLPQLYDYIHSKFPDAKYYWLQSWTHELGKGDVITQEDQDKIALAYKVVSKEVCAQYPFTNVPCGDAWQAVRHDPLLYKEGELTLHTRIFNGKPNHDDKTHDGDVGGGQYLNACVWFEMLTGQSCVGNTFRPKYIYKKEQDLSLSEEKIVLLQNTAHAAVTAAATDA